MARGSFTHALQRRVPCPSTEGAGATVREVLRAAFAALPPSAAYVLDEQGALRRHRAVFVDGRQARDRIGLSDPAEPGVEVCVVLALSGC